MELAIVVDSQFSGADRLRQKIDWSSLGLTVPAEVNELALKKKETGRRCS